MESSPQIPVCKKCGGPREESCPPDFCIPCSQADATLVESTVSEVAESVCADPAAPAAHEHDDMPRTVKSEAEWEEEEARLIDEEWTQKEQDYMRSVRASQSHAADTVQDSQVGSVHHAARLLYDFANSCLQEQVSTVPTAPADDLPALNRGFLSPVARSRETQVPESPVYAPESPPSPVPGPQQHPHTSRGRSPYIPPVSQVPSSPPAAPSAQATEPSAPAPAPKQQGKVRMTPACARCKRSKIRCVHRRVLDDDGRPAAAAGTYPLPFHRPLARRKDAPTNNAAAPAPAVKKRKRADEPANPDATQGGGDDGAAVPAAKRKLRLRAPRKPADEEKPAAPEQEGKRPRGRPRKRKAVTFEEGVDEEAEGEGPPAKRGRKEQGDDDDAGVSAAARRGAAAMMDSVEGASVLAMHGVLSRELEEKLAACRTSLQATIDAIHDAKGILDAWVEAWTRRK
ncbi:hypothetical protein ATEIFO6365_0009027800 [Aspergillus terreus]|uniref:Uncharacterized protein n=1 Tax=Aspergillus terreus TaxID=33178 RepID=A0A5M3Z806_ASPTE|nr:hypothetical protein ATETN484_0011027800 [Aspergillus terreus]GFF18915.1 hypothetical protein ATEIFO6365_0009027800 [Aspergillus terreus]